MINESYYVDINVNYKKPTLLTGSVPMTAFISTTAYNKMMNDNQHFVSGVYNSLTELYTAFSPLEYPAVADFGQAYFNNGGQTLLVFAQGGTVADAQAVTDLLLAYSDFIWVTFEATKTADQIKPILNVLSASNQPLPKFLSVTTSDNGIVASLNENIGETGIKYTSRIAVTYYNDDTVPYESCMIIPAYFSSVNLGQDDTLKSIVHTQVNGITDSETNQFVNFASAMDSTTLDTVYSNNMNAIVNLGGRYVTFDGGKMASGEPIHSAWGFAVFKKDCEDVLTDLLVTKLPYQNSSNVIVENSLSKVCNRYVLNGLIGGTTREYRQGTKTYSYNGVDYTIIEDGQLLTDGYTIFSIPISNATPEDIDAGRVPPVFIYAIINNIIRMFVVNVEVN